VTLHVEALYAAKLIRAVGTNNQAVWARVLQEMAATEDYELIGGVMYNLARSAANSLKKVNPETWEKNINHSFHGDAT
jgi:hypothetical protein